MSDLVVVTGGDAGQPAVLHLHSPGGFPLEVEALAAIADEVGVRTVGVEREGLAVDGGRSVAAVASAALEFLGDRLPPAFSVVAWSGGAPFAVAAAALLPRRVRKAVLVCPLPGWLRGNGAIPAESSRLAAIAAGGLTGIPGAAELEVVAEPWGVDIGDMECPAVVWYGGKDDVIPAGLVERTFGKLRRSELRLFPDDTHFLPMGRWPELLRLAAK